MTLAAEPFLVLEVEIGAPISLGDAGAGVRRTIPITGGTFSGEISGRVLAGGADWQTVLADGTVDLSAHYVLEGEDGGRIEVTSDGLASGPAEDRYFRTAMRFRTGWPAYQHLNRLLAVTRASAARGKVRMEVFRVL